MTDLLTLLDPTSMTLDLVAETREDAIGQLVGLMATSGAVRDRDAFVQAVLAREAEGSTAMGEGIAIPHGKSDGVGRPALAFARAPRGVEWGSADETAAELIFLIGVPAARAGDEHLRILALLARKLVNSQFRARLQNATSIEEVRQVLAEVG